MAIRGNMKQPGVDPAAVDSAVDLELDRIASATIDELRALWRERQGQDAPAAFSKDLLARALAYFVQEERFGRLEPRLRRLLDRDVLSTVDPSRHVKVGSIIVREHAGVVHEVMVVPGGFCWQGKTFASLSSIAKCITGTTWNGPRFFGLRGKDAGVIAKEADAPSPANNHAGTIDAAARRVQIGGARRRPRREEANP